MGFEGDPIDDETCLLFHGTSLNAAKSILADGFDLAGAKVFIEVGGGRFEEGVFWTRSRDIALKFAEIASRNSGFEPALLAASLTSVLEAGLPVADLNTWKVDFKGDQEMRPSGWAHSLALLGNIAVVGCRHVQGLRLAPITTDPELVSVLDTLSPIPAPSTWNFEEDEGDENDAEEAIGWHP